MQAAAAQAAVAAQAAALEQLREKLESGEPPEKKMALVADEQQRLMQRALQQNFLAMTAQLPMSIRINSQGTDPAPRPSVLRARVAARALEPSYVKSAHKPTRKKRATKLVEDTGSCAECILVNSRPSPSRWGPARKRADTIFHALGFENMSESRLEDSVAVREDLGMRHCSAFTITKAQISDRCVLVPRTRTEYVRVADTAHGFVTPKA